MAQPTQNPILDEAAIAELAAQHGGERGRVLVEKTATRPSRFELAPGQFYEAENIPEQNPDPQYTIEFGDGSSIVVRPRRDEQYQPTGDMEVVSMANLKATPPGGVRQAGPPTATAGGREWQYNPETGAYDKPVGPAEGLPLTPAEQAALANARTGITAEARMGAAQEAANAIAQGRLDVDRAAQALNEGKFRLDQTLAKLQEEGRLDERATKWAMFEYDKLHNAQLAAERGLARMEARYQFGEEQARAERTSQVAQRGQDIEAAAGLGRGAQEAALGTFMGTVPEGTTEFFNKALMGMGSFFPGGPSAVPQLRQAPSVQVPTDLTQVGTRVASAVMGGQVPGVLPPRINAPAPLVGQAGPFNGAEPVVDEEAAAAAQEAAQQAMQELMADEGPGPMEEPEEEEPEMGWNRLRSFRGYAGIPE